MIYRSQHIQKYHKSLLYFAAAFFIVTAIGITVWFIRQRTVTTPHAAASTTLSFATPIQTIAAGQSMSSDIMVNPGTNQVSLVKVFITYDGSKLQANGASSLVVNQAAFPQTLVAPTTSCNGTQCTLSATFSIGSDPTKAIQTTTKMATLNLTAIAGTNGSTTQIAFDQSTSVYSIAQTDQASENVLSSTTPLTVTITGNGNTCQMNQATCSWNNANNTTTYHYVVVETDSGTTIQTGDVQTPQTRVTFPSEPGKTYSCTVNAVNACGQGTAGLGTSTCPLPSATPTPSETPTPSTCVSPGTVQNLHIICPNCNQ